MTSLRVLIVGWFTYPFGTAQGSRARMFAKGLQAAGADVRVLAQMPIDRRPEDVQPDGSLAYEGIRYESAAGLLDDRRRSARERLARYVGGIQRSIRRAREIIVGERINAVIVCTLSYPGAQPIVRFCRQRGVAVAVDANEWFIPSAHPGGILGPFYWSDWLKRVWTNRRAHGVIAISSFLERRYTAWRRPVLRVPCLFDFAAHPAVARSQVPRQAETFSLVVAGGLKRVDGPADMLAAVRLARLRGCPVTLTLLGTSGRAGLGLQMRRMCAQDDILRDRVHFLGWVPEDEYLATLGEASAFIMARPDTVMAHAAFPTRLPEYLSTGRPVLTTTTPDMPEYLTDGVDACLVAPQRPDLLAERIIWLWHNPTLADALGAAGRERGAACFDYRMHGRRLAEFLTALLD
jgi:glycosyltransferase involved in cell wall biosynthesis